MSEFYADTRRLGRRTLQSTGGLGLAGAGAYLYHAGPRLFRQYRNEMKRPVEPARFSPDPHNWPSKGLQAAWLGHSTVLLRLDGFTILTDPVFSVRAGVHLGLVTIGVKRLTAAALPIEALPNIDLILLSHAHMDHFDTPSLRALENHRTTVVTAPRTSDLLHVGQFRAVHEVGWRQDVRVGPARIQGLEVNHWGARFRTDTYRGYTGYLIDTGRYRVVFAGDTADCSYFREVGGADLAIMPIGAYNPWIRFHCTPEQAWRMAREARAERILPVHHKTFLLSREPLVEPIERLVHAAGSANEDAIVLREIGQEFKI